MKYAIGVAAALAAYAVVVAAPHTIGAATARDLLPRWDLATHLGHAWQDYHLLIDARIPALLWDLWQQGYWPPGFSLLQLPFFVALGGHASAGAWSVAFAFVLLAATGAALLARARGSRALVAVCTFAALLVTSPFLLAYGTVAMTEVPGALAQMLVLLAYARWTERQDARRSRHFALSLTALFFVKYNYFLMLAVPLALHEWLERTAGQSGREQWAGVTRATRRLRTSPVFLFLAVYAAALAIIVITGGFAFDVSGQRVSVRSVGNSGIVVFYILLCRLAYLHRRGRIDWRRLMDADPRVRPLLIWFAVPVTVWLASPHPNHIRDVLNLVVNRPLGEATVRTATASYLQSLGNDYFISPWLAAVVAGACLIAALSYARQPRVMRLVIVAIPLQFAAIAVHQTRFPRFLLLTVVLLCLVAAGEIGRWFAGARARAAAWGVSSALVLTAAISVNQLVSAERFTAIAFEHYTDAPALKQALAAIRRELQPGDRLLVVGQSNILSPALFRWELGPPSGGPAYPFRIGGAGRLHPDDASHVLVLVPLGDAGALDPERNDPARLRALQESIDGGRLVLRRDWPVRDLGVVLRFYARR